MAHLLLQIGESLLEHVCDCVLQVVVGVLCVQVCREQELGKLQHCLPVLHFCTSEVSIVLVGSIGSHLLEGKSLAHAVVVMEHTECCGHLLGVGVIEDVELLCHDSVLREVGPKRQLLGEFVDDADRLTLGLGGLESSLVLELLLLLTHLSEHLVDILREVGSLDLQCLVVEHAERLRVDLQDSFSSQILALGPLIVADLFFNSKSIVLCLDDMPVGGQTREDGDFVDLELFQPHKEVVDVTVLSLHDDLRDHSWQLLLLGWKQGSHRQ